MTLVTDSILPHGFPTWAAMRDGVGLAWVHLIGMMVLASNEVL